jgi:class 3 adenylate cyclase
VPIVEVYMFLEELGEQIRDARSRKKLTQNDVARVLQISPQAVSKWERGENAPDISLLPRLCVLLGVSTDRLLRTNIPNEKVFEATVCFSDIPRFTQRAEGLDPEDVANLLNAHYFQMTELVLRFDGVPVKYIGDAFLCFFAGPEHRLRAAKTWIHAKKVLAENISIGCHSGPIFLGRLGHPEYAQMDIMGDTVNGAARTEGWAGQTESKLGASMTAVEGIEESLSFGKIEETQMKGKTGTYTLYEITGMTQ